MRDICILAAVIAIIASPALAQSRKAQVQPAPEATLYDPYGSQKRYTDPDPNIRFEMLRQRNWRKGG
jgi:hypothetical protein